MKTKVDIGIIGAMDPEVDTLVSKLENRTSERVGSILFHVGELHGKRVALARCGIGKVFAAICAEAMILTYSPSLLINTGVGGGLKRGISVTDIVIGEKLVQHDMDTSALGDPKGLVSGINKIYFESDARAISVLSECALELGLVCHVGVIASGDRFVAATEDKSRIVADFDASVCEMEGAAIAQVAFVNDTPFCVIRSVSDSADEGSSMDYLQFLPIAADASAKLTEKLCQKL